MRQMTTSRRTKRSTKSLILKFSALMKMRMMTRMILLPLKKWMKKPQRMLMRMRTSRRRTSRRNTILKILIPDCLRTLSLQ